MSLLRGRKEIMMKATYNVEYKMDMADEIKRVDVIASNKEEAWEKATYEVIPEIEGFAPYSSWTNSVTYKNGNFRTFNTFEGKPY